MSLLLIYLYLLLFYLFYLLVFSKISKAAVAIPFNGRTNMTNVEP
jgi:hypothetical protein